MQGRSLRRTTVAVCACAGVLLAALVCAPPVRPAPGYLLIVHAANPVDTLSPGDVSRLFLKKTSRWPNGGEAMPLDLAPSFPARGAFSREVLKRSVRAVQAYWKRQIFSGRSSPPPELASEEEMVAAVRSDARALGYVSDEASLAGVKVIDVLEPAPPAAEGP